MYEKLKQLAEKSTLNKDDKAFIVEASKELGVKFEPQSGCKNCYFDQIFVLTNAIKASDLKPNEGCDYLLNPELKLDVIHRGVRINAENLDNEKAQLLIKDGLLRWFSIYPKNEDKQ